MPAEVATLPERIRREASERLADAVPGNGGADVPERVRLGSLLAGVTARALAVRAREPAAEGAEPEWAPVLPPPDLAHYREVYRMGMEHLRDEHRRGAGGLIVAQGRAALMDIIVETLFRHAVAEYGARHGPLPCPVSLLALGGYGRSELCPSSDVDLMFLFPDRIQHRGIDQLKEVLTRTILYALWDLGKKVGHSTRTVREAVEEARRNMLTKNALLESRRIAGSQALFESFQEAYRGFCRNDRPQDYIQQRLEDQVARRLKYGNTVFLQEPDIKNGVGGLRDYQNILWMAGIKLPLAGVEDLAREGFLRPSELEAFTTAYDYLLRVRNELHFSYARPTELIDLEKQPQLAMALGYTDPDLFVRVEAFMRDYYRHAQVIFRTSALLEQRLALQATRGISLKAVIAARRHDRKREIDGFLIAGRSIAAAKPTTFAEDPERIIRVYRHAQQYRAQLDFELVSLLNESLHLLPEKVAHSPTASRTLLSILQDVGNVHTTLLQMHEHGVLERIVPEFAGLTCLVQHELYHRYTADIHTLNTISELDRIFSNDDEGAHKYHEAIHDTEAPWLLYLILLLHDIGKGDGVRGHAERGAAQAGEVVNRLGLSPELRDKVMFIIAQHLEMARFWQHHDVEDPKAAATFAEQVGDPELLRYLFVHTYCDARGTASSLWNTFKDLLHTTLFEHALEILTAPRPEPTAFRPRPAMIPPDVIRQRVPELSREEIEAHYRLLPERYFIYHQADEVILHLRMVHELLHRVAGADSVSSLLPVIDWEDDLSLSMTVVDIVTWDRAGLFYKLAGAFSIAGLNILSSKAISREDHITIDTFYVCEPGGGVVQNPQARPAFEKALAAALIEDRDLLPDILAQARKVARPSLLQNDGYLRGPVPVSVNVYHELSLSRTIIEIQAEDQIGLLYRLAKAIFDHGFDITFARISTERGVAVDTFYIEPIQAGVERASELQALRSTLESIVRPDNPAVT